MTLLRVNNRLVRSGGKLVRRTTPCRCCGGGPCTGPCCKFNGGACSAPADGLLSHAVSMRTSGTRTGTFPITWSNLLSAATVPLAGEDCDGGNAFALVTKRPPANISDLVVMRADSEFATLHPSGNPSSSVWIPPGDSSYTDGDPIVYHGISSTQFGVYFQFHANLRTGATGQALAVRVGGSGGQPAGRGGLHTAAEALAVGYRNISGSGSTSLSWAGCVPTITFSGTLSADEFDTLTGDPIHHEVFTVTAFSHTITGLSNV